MANLSKGQLYYYSGIVEQEAEQETNETIKRTGDIMTAWGKAHPERDGKGDWFTEIVPWYTENVEGKENGGEDR